MKKKLWLFLLVFFFISCYAFRPKGETLQEAWYKYWSYIKQREFKKAFYYEHLFLSPERTPEEYAKGMATSLKVKKFELLEIGKEDSGPMGSTLIKMKLVTNWPPIIHLKNDRVVVKYDYWVKKNNKWYHLRRGFTGFW